MDTRQISIHAPIVGCDHCHIVHTLTVIRRFQSTHPSWGATSTPMSQKTSCIKFQSTHPSWGATVMLSILIVQRAISIHAPIVGCDINNMMDQEIFKISIHAPIVGCDRLQRFEGLYNQIFQSTHPSWGATMRDGHFDRYNFISIHAPIVGCDVGTPPI